MPGCRKLGLQCCHLSSGALQEERPLGPSARPVLRVAGFPPGAFQSDPENATSSGRRPPPEKSRVPPGTEGSLCRRSLLERRGARIVGAPERLPGRANIRSETSPKGHLATD